MELFTKIKIYPSELTLNYQSKIGFIGSCFAENISKRFSQLKFNTLTNPFGVIYNPLSIERLIKNILHKKTYTKNDFFQDGLWHSFDAHSSLSRNTLEESITTLNQAIINARHFIENAHCIFITLGSAFVYSLNSTGEIVSNCHRQNPNIFHRKLISVKQSESALLNTIQMLHEINENLHIIFTVSPIRHLGDTAHGNNLSKGTLLLSIHEALNKEKLIEYFPSYEILLDELRDYRFYNDDMIHPSETAVDIIFEKMLQTYCQEETINNILHVQKFLKNTQHKIEDTHSEKSKIFAEKCLKKIKELETQIMGLNLEEESKYFKKIKDS